MSRLGFFTLCAFFSGAACAPTLAGHLKGPSGEVVTNSEARVNVVSLGSGEGEAQIVTLEVDGQGEFSTSEELAPGPYLVEALVPGYALASKKVGPDETQQVELTLAPTGPVKAATTRANTELDAARGGGDVMLTPPSL